MGSSPRAPLLMVALLATIALAGCQQKDMGWPRPQFAPNVEVGPQVACVTRDSARIVWRTLAHVQSAVEVRTPGGEWRACGGGEGAARDHDVKIDGLKAASAVEYRLLHDGMPVTEAASFRTAGNGEFTFAVIGDTGSGGAGQIAVREQLAAIDPLFVLHVGDIAYDFGRRVEVVRRYFVPFQTLLATRPWYVAWGNHDVMTEGGAQVRELFRFPESIPGRHDRYYAFDWGDLRVWALDLTIDWGKGSDQYAWLAGDLAASRAEWKVVYGHYPPYSASPYAKTFPDTWKRMRAELCPLFEANGVAVYFSGHTHGYERSYPIRGQKRVGRGEGPVYVVCGGGGKLLNPAGTDSWTAVSASTLQCMAVDVSADALTGRAIDAHGDEIDVFTIPAKR